MTLLSHNRLLELIKSGVIDNATVSAVNAASIDIHLGNIIIAEDFSIGDDDIIDYREREKPKSNSILIGNDGFVLRPGQFILAQSVEVFNLPNNISAEYKLKSSMARIGLEHMNAGWCDAGWHGSVLTLEFKNMLQMHSILLRPGDAIGQMVFFEHEPVPEHASYATKGRYNNDATVSGIKQ